jgi:23S rRNA (adenine-N6)-dimethyltransferase
VSAERRSGGSRRQWGWHRLHPRWAEQFVAASGVRRGDLVLDIGAGDGALTRPLVRLGATVIAIEGHPLRASSLRAEFGREVVVVSADASDLRLPRRPFHVVANPPFAATSAVLRRLLHPGSRLVSAHLVLDERAITRWIGSHAPAATRWQESFEVVLGDRLPRRAFDPPPEVRCRVLTLRRRR